MTEQTPREMTPRRSAHSRLFDREARLRNPVINLHRRDVEILHHLFNTRLLSSRLLALLEKTPGTQDESVVRRLKKLFWAGYLDRPCNQAHHTQDPYSGKYTGLLPLVYALGHRGARVIGDEVGDHNIGRLNWLRTNRDLAPLNIDHALLTAHVYTVVQLALRALQKAGTAAELMYWKEGQEDLKDIFHVDQEGKLVLQPRPGDNTERLVIYPDAMFSIALTAKTVGERVARNVLLESDRGTETTGRVMSKLRAFALWERFGLHTRTFGIKRFVVLVLTLSAKRRDSLLQMTRELAECKRRSALFLFAALEDLPLAHPARVFDSICYSPAQDQPTSILD